MKVLIFRIDNKGFAVAGFWCARARAGQRSNECKRDAERWWYIGLFLGENRYMLSEIMWAAGMQIGRWLLF